MRVSRRGAQLLAAALLLLPAGARADELLVMPYSCTMAGGQPVLTPGPEQSHRILGARDQRKFNACSPVNPDMCRSWVVHRFDLDCDGKRVPWVSVVAASNEGSRRAWLLDGRLVLRMGPRWSLPSDDPCARAPDVDDRAGGRRARGFCADRLASAPPPVVELPFGYAPMLGIDGIIVKATPGFGGRQPLPPVSAAPAPAPSASAGPLAELFPAPPQQQERVQPPRAELQPAEPQGVDPGARPVMPPRVPQTAPQPLPNAADFPAAPAATPPPQEGPRPAPATPAIPPPAAAAPKAAQAEIKTDAKQAAPTPNLGPRVVALSPPATNSTAPANPTAAAPAATTTTTTVEAKPGATNAARTPQAATSPAPSGNAPSRPATEEGADSGVGLLSVFRTTTTGVIVAFAGLALGLLTAFALARRREHLSDTRRPPRDLAAVSLDGRRGARSRPAAAKVRGTLPPHAPAPATGRGPGDTATAGAIAERDDRMPRTRAEALDVLGIGIAPSASEAALKKIVDGLRQSWHPDHATDETDRALRELRSKQINAAWDLLREQRAVV